MSRKKKTRLYRCDQCVNVRTHESYVIVENRKKKSGRFSTEPKSNADAVVIVSRRSEDEYAAREFKMTRAEGSCDTVEKKENPDVRGLYTTLSRLKSRSISEII